ncbi:MAG: hypothetical protein CTY24_11720, partial [Methylobacter sp.]
MESKKVGESAVRIAFAPGLQVTLHPMQAMPDSSQTFFYFCIDRNKRYGIITAMNLNPVAQRFILHWGEMGS